MTAAKAPDRPAALCPTGYALFQAWVNTVQPVTPQDGASQPTPEQVSLFAAQKESADYRIAHYRYTEHRRNCPTCRERWIK